jgi:cytochrome c biogenesis protein CcmG, thiol:disulfide interchange protein DsbE
VKPAAKGDGAVGMSGRQSARVRWRAVAITAFAVSALLFVLASGFGHDPRIVPSVLVRKPAPPFALRDLSTGDRVSLRSLRGQPVVLTFWSSWCAACWDEQAALDAASSRFAPRGVAFLGIVFQDTDANALAYRQSFGGGWAALADPGSETALRYGVTGVPETFFVAKDGRIVYKEAGPVTASVLRTWIGRIAPATRGG